MTAARFLSASVATAAASVALAGCSVPDDRPESSPSTSTAPESSGAASDPSSDSYRDGTYEATGWYGRLPSHHDVTVTIADDVITDVLVSTPAEDPTSLAYQRAFAAAVPGAVVGRRLDEVQIDRLAGASGCPAGFMDALERIKDDAAA